MLKQMILREIEKGRTTSIKLANMVGYANDSPITLFLSNSKMEMDDFSALLKIVKHLFPEEEYERMDQYCRTLNPNEKAARISLEYAVKNALHELFAYLLGKLSVATNPESREWASVYQFLSPEFLTQYPSHRAINELHKLKLTSMYMDVLKNIILMYKYYDLDSYLMVEELAMHTQHQLIHLDVFGKRKIHSLATNLYISLANPLLLRFHARKGMV